MIVNIVNFPNIKEGKDTEFRQWFKWSNSVFSKHKGFISRRLLKPTDGKGNYIAIVEYESMETFRKTQKSKDHEEALSKVKPLFEGMPEPRFYEVVIE